MWSFLIPARGKAHSAWIHAKKRTSGSVDRDRLAFLTCPTWRLHPADWLSGLTLEPGAPDVVTPGAISIRFTTNDAEAAHAALAAASVDTDEILRWPGVPRMFAFRDPDGNVFSITETA